MERVTTTAHLWNIKIFILPLMAPGKIWLSDLMSET